MRSPRSAWEGTAVGGGVCALDEGHEALLEEPFRGYGRDGLRNHAGGQHSR
ncbi:hypothetical protein SsS58_05727 [Streptomyces scabiei]|uniref:Uncharacterized protein n=1 Tax=Streptomyces scabiei TaxID=1930 RepID=A0A124C4R8_STRSC|nr:hypothetical protein SsS58_05727 [Streptomyces scabiei]